MACNNLNPKWTQQEIDKLKGLIGQISFEEMTTQFQGRSKMSLVHKADKLGLSNNYRTRKYSFDIDFWKTPNLINCYFAGFIAADGYINSKSLVLSLSTKDLIVLEKLREACCFTGNIRSYQRKNYKKETLKQVSTLTINSIHYWEDDLKNNFNIVTKKTFILQPPNLINNLLIFSYLIGYLDGDGWIYLNKRGKLVLGYVDGSYDHICWIKSFFDKYFPESLRNESRKPKIKRGTKDGKVSNCFYFTFNGSRSLKIVDFLRRFPIFKLDRKWNNPAILARIEEMKLKHPDFFTLSSELQNIKDQLANYQHPTI